MLSGPDLGKAIKAAMDLKGVKQRHVAEEFGVSQPSVSEWIKFGRVDKRHISHLMDYFSSVVGPGHWGLVARRLDHGEVIDAVEVHQSPNEGTALQAVRETLTHTLSLPPFTVAHKQITWGDLVKELPERFVLPLRDEALAPAYAAGTKGIFSTAAEARPNKIALVADSDGNHYVRRIAERRIGQWQAVADGPGFQPLDFEADRLRVVAVMVGHEWE